MPPFQTMKEIAGLASQEFEETCREHTSYAYLGDHLALCRVLSRFKIYIDTRDIGISPHFIQDGFWETWVTQCLAREVSQGNICIDAGANFGYYSLLMSALSGSGGRTIAVEPHPHISQLLRHTQSVHPWKFDVVEAALGDTSGDALLSIPEHYTGGSTILKETHFIPESRIKVRSLSLDDLVKEMDLPRVDVIKMDVEGAEPSVFEGMKETIKNNPGLKIIMEYSPFFYKNAKEFSDYLLATFVINRIKDVIEMQQLDYIAMNGLLKLKDHTDLFLVQKNL
jgi:FkbM family methyltransferase